MNAKTVKLQGEELDSIAIVTGRMDAARNPIPDEDSLGRPTFMIVIPHDGKSYRGTIRKETKDLLEAGKLKAIFFNLVDDQQIPTRDNTVEGRPILLNEDGSQKTHSQNTAAYISEITWAKATATAKANVEFTLASDPYAAVKLQAFTKQQLAEVVVDPALEAAMAG